MGKRSRELKERREQRERIQRGDEQHFAAPALRNPIARKAVVIASHGAVVQRLKEASLGEQIEVLGSVSPSKVGGVIMRKAPAETDRGIRNFQKQGKKVTVGGLLEEVRTTPGFLTMCENAGVTYTWFERLARERMRAHGIMED